MAPSPKPAALVLPTLTAVAFVAGHARVIDFEALEEGGTITRGILETFSNAT